MNKKLKIVIPIIVFLILGFTSYGYAALNTELQLSGEAYVRTDADIRITNLKLSAMGSGGYELYNSKYFQKNLSVFPMLPSGQSALYEVEITNKSGDDYFLKDIISTGSFELVDAKIYSSFPKNSVKTFFLKVTNKDASSKELSLSMEFVFEKDKEPTITLANLPSWNTKGDEYLVSPVYDAGPSGGAASCKSNIDTQLNNVTDLKSLSTGTHDITCTVTSNSGKTASVTKRTKITYDLYTISNIVENGSFEDDTYWTLRNASYSTVVAKSGKRSVALQPNINYSSVDRSISAPIYGHKYYGITWFYTSDTFETVGQRFEWWLNDQRGGLLTFGWKNRTSSKWQWFSSVQELNGTDYLTSTGWYIRNFVTASNQVSYIDDIVIVDLTKTFGEGLEPTKAWCDKHIKYFNGTTTIYK